MVGGPEFSCRPFEGLGCKLSNRGTGFRTHNSSCYQLMIVLVVTSHFHLYVRISNCRCPMNKWLMVGYCGYLKQKITEMAASAINLRQVST